MNQWILDTDILTLLQEGHPRVSLRCATIPPNDLAISILSVEEQLSGWYMELRKAKRPERLAWAYGRLTKNVTFLSRLSIFTFDEVAIRRYQELSKLRLNVRKMDLRIAAIVLERNAILVTRNLRDFQRIPGLRLEDWTS